MYMTENLNCFRNGEIQIFVVINQQIAVYGEHYNLGVCQKNNINRFAWYIVKHIIEPTNNVPNVTGTTNAYFNGGKQERIQLSVNE